MDTVDRLARPATGRALAWIAALAVAISACGLTNVLPGPRPLGEHGFIEFQPQPPPPGVEPQPALAAARAAADGYATEFGLDLSRRPEVLEYGIATCAEEPGCLGQDIGASQRAVWLITWQPDGGATWMSVLFDPATGETLWIGADGPAG